MIIESANTSTDGYKNNSKRSKRERESKTTMRTIKSANSDSKRSKSSNEVNCKLEKEGMAGDPSGQTFNHSMKETVSLKQNTQVRINYTDTQS